VRHRIVAAIVDAYERDAASGQGSSSPSGGTS
jgi:hypothetical protein